MGSFEDRRLRRVAQQLREGDMAAGRDTRRETVRIRREQAERNRAATEENDRLRTEAERQQGMTAAELRRQQTLERRAPRVEVRQEGRRAVYAKPAPSEDKMKRQRGRNKLTDNSLSKVYFASPTAGKLAAEAKLTAADFRGVKPSGVSGYTAADVRQIIGERAGG